MAKEHLQFDIKGFAVKKFQTVAGKSDEDHGSITLTLVADKGDVVVHGADGNLNVSDVVAALNLHQELNLEIPITLNVPVEPSQVSSLKASRAQLRPTAA